VLVSFLVGVESLYSKASVASEDVHSRLSRVEELVKAHLNGLPEEKKQALKQMKIDALAAGPVSSEAQAREAAHRVSVGQESYAEIISVAEYEDEECSILESGYLTVNPTYCLPVLNHDYNEYYRAIKLSCNSSLNKFKVVMYNRDDCSGMNYALHLDLLACGNTDMEINDKKFSTICEPNVPQFPSVSAVLYNDVVNCYANEVPELGWFTPMYQCVKNTGGIFSNSTDQPYMNVTECSIDGLEDGVDTAHTTYFHDANCTNATGYQWNEDMASECIVDLADKWDSFFGYPISESASAKMGCFPQDTIIETRLPSSNPTRAPTNDDSDDNNDAVIAGATLGSLFAVGLIGVVAYYAYFYYGPGKSGLAMSGKKNSPMQDQENASDWFSRVSGFTGESTTATTTNPRYSTKPSSASPSAGSNPLHAQANLEESSKYELFDDSL